MRPQNKQRSRNKPGGNGGHQNNQQRQQRMGNIINRVFESAGPDGKVRGTPQQIIDKYQALARDAQVSGDRVAAESYLQHSEHYSRLLGEAQRQQLETRLQQQDREDGQQQQPRGDDGFERERRPQPAVVPVASGLTIIDPDEPDYPGGPIETPRAALAGRRAGAGGAARRAAAAGRGVQRRRRPRARGAGRARPQAVAAAPAAVRRDRCRGGAPARVTVSGRRPARAAAEGFQSHPLGPLGGWNPHGREMSLDVGSEALQRSPQHLAPLPEGGGRHTG